MPDTRKIYRQVQQGALHPPAAHFGEEGVEAQYELRVAFKQFFDLQDDACRVNSVRIHWGWGRHDWPD